MEKYQDTWATSLENEIGKLAQGIHDVPGTNAILFIPKSDIPKERQKKNLWKNCGVVQTTYKRK